MVREVRFWYYERKKHPFYSFSFFSKRILVRIQDSIKKVFSCNFAFNCEIVGIIRLGSSCKQMEYIIYLESTLHGPKMSKHARCSHAEFIHVRLSNNAASYTTTNKLISKKRLEILYFCDGLAKTHSGCLSMLTTNVLGNVSCENMDFAIYSSAEFHCGFFCMPYQKIIIFIGSERALTVIRALYGNEVAIEFDHS